MTARRLFLSLLPALAIALAAAQPAQAGKFHGVVTQGPLNAADYQRMGQGNVGQLRLTIPWRNLEPSRGNRNWSSFDAVVEAAARNGVRVLPAIIGPGPAGTKDPPTNGASRKAHSRFVGAMAARYGRGGDFWEGASDRKPITAWQIRNEQNGPAYWDGRPNPRAYAKLVKPAAKAITRQDGRAEIVLGGMFGTPSGAGAKTSWGYLRALYRVKGFKQAFDTVAVHPYSENLRGIKFQIRKIRDVMGQGRDRGAKLRITELGWGSGRGGGLNKGRRGQAQMLKQAYGLFERKRGAWNVSSVDWFSWQDNRAAGCSFCPTSGLFTSGRQAKPAWAAFKRIAR